MTELIDRQAALKKLCETCGYCERLENAVHLIHPDFVSDKCNMYKFLAEQPTIEAEPVRHGRWIEATKHRDENGTIMTDYECSECCAMVKDSYAEEIGSERFCYNCGADMREGGADI